MQYICTEREHYFFAIGKVRPSSVLSMENDKCVKTKTTQINNNKY